MSAGAPMITSLLSPFARVAATRAISIPPHEWPSASYSLIPKYSNKFCSSSINSASVQNVVSPFFSGRCVERPPPSWS